MLLKSPCPVSPSPPWPLDPIMKLLVSANPTSHLSAAGTCCQGMGSAPSQQLWDVGLGPVPAGGAAGGGSQRGDGVRVGGYGAMGDHEVGYGVKEAVGLWKGKEWGY